MKFCERKDLIDRQSYVAQYVSLAMFTIGCLTLLGSDDLLGAFACGTAFAWDGFFNRQTEQSVFSSVIDLLFNIAAFVYIGAWMPFNSFNNEELTLSVWRLIVIAILVLLLRRLPIMLALYRWIPDVKTFREAIFSGHFGPMGVGAVFISVLASEKLPHPEEPMEDQAELLAATIQPIVAFMVLTSITIHGLSIPFFSISRRVHSVTRTWSRHQSMGSMAPEWATQTRRITRPEEIIINRDSVMERGEMVPSEKMTGTGTPSGEDDSEKKSLHMSSEPASDRGDATTETEGRPDAPPDEAETVTEWREGPDIVLEKRAGPGDEVEVEVIHTGAPTSDNVLGSVQGKEGEIEHALREPTGRFMEEVHKRKKEVEDNMNGLKDGLKEGVRALEDGSAERLRKLTGSPQSANKHHGSRPGSSGSTSGEYASAIADDEEEGWTSEGSQASGSSHTRARTKSGKGKHGSKSHTLLHPHGHSHSHTHFTQRRRNSMRRGVLRPLSAGSTHSTPDEDAERGRSAITAASAPATPVSATEDGNFERGQGLHRRVESLRRPPTRSQSPAHSLRSIRFADDQNVLPSPVSRATSGSGNSGEGKSVTFDLPNQGV
jgi:hypothetical protein